MGREKDRDLMIIFQYLKPVMPTAPGHFITGNNTIFFFLVFNCFEFGFYYLQSKKNLGFLTVAGHFHLQWYRTCCSFCL